MVLGGARSGKSRQGEALVRAAGPAPWTYVATAEAFDAEMAERIARHREDRGAGWVTIEAPHDLVGALRTADAAGRPVLVDCLTLWLTNRMLADADLAAEGDALVAALAGLAVPVVAVSNEVGLGIVPDNALARAFRDAQGRLNQAVAARADRVLFMAAGLALRMK
nr:bifunctional adenosylcobinamide kinase/adenosylcobinamide-phosphate guanylyltransferase [Oharaeibacter diazotrophicus]